MRSLGYFTYDPAQKNSRDLATKAYKDYCANAGHIVTGCFAEETTATGRPEWEKMLRHVEESRLGYLVVVPTAAHLGASLPERIKSVLDLDSLSCQTICSDKDYPDPIQNAVRNTHAPNSRRERIREGMRAKAAKGLGLGKPPYGYKILWDGTFALVEGEAEVVRAMFERYATDEGGVRAVATWLNDAGKRTRRGQRWSMVTVRDILRNTAYIGTYRRFGLRLPSSYQAIVHRDVFRAVQEKMQGRTPTRRNPKGEPFLLSGVIYCGHCGQRMMGVVRRQSWRRKDGHRAKAEYRYYQCQSRINRNQCEYRTVSAPELERLVIDEVRSSAEKPASAADADVVADGGLRTEVRRDIESRIGAIKRRYESIVERAANGGLTLGQLRAVTIEAESQLRAAQSELALAEQGAEGIRALVDDSRDRLMFLWDDLSTTERQSVLRKLVARVVVKDGKPRVESAVA